MTDIQSTNVVKVLYDYSYFSSNDQKDISFKAGEEYHLVLKAGDNWWYVKRQLEDQEGVYVPAQYVKEIKQDLASPHSPPLRPAPMLSLGGSTKLKKPQEDVSPTLDKKTFEELNEIFDNLNVPEAYQDPSQSTADTDNLSGNSLSPNDHHSTTVDFQLRDCHSDEHVNPTKGLEYPVRCQQSKEEMRVESETSDYKTDSRESLESEGRGFMEGSGRSKEDEEVTSGGSHGKDEVTSTVDIVDLKPQCLRGTLSSQSMDDYANLEEIQRAIHSSRNGSQKAPPPLADNLMPPGYCRPYQDQNPATPPIAKPQTPQIDQSEKSVTGAELSPQSSPNRTSKMILQPKMVDKQGPLQKAKVEENSKKMKKSWSPSYVVLCQNLLYFYKDSKSSSAKPRSITSLGKPEFMVDLKGATISSAPEDKNVKKDAFMLITTATHFLLFHEDHDNNQHWRHSIQNNINALNAGLLPNSTGSLGKNKPDSSSLSSTCDAIESKQTIKDRLVKFLLRRPTKESIKKKGIYKEVTFGSSLTAICERDKEKVPRFVKECILAIEARGLTVDGLYRVSGNVSTVQKLRNMVDQNEYYDLMQPTWDIHTITGALKLFFRELSEPLFTFKLFQPFVASLNNLNAVKDLVKQLPPVHLKTMRLLFKHFTLVLQHSRENRMQGQGMAIVFGPTLLWPENQDSNLALSLVQQGQLVEYIINNCRAIFG